MALTICNSSSRYCFRLLRDCKPKIKANVKEMSAAVGNGRGLPLEIVDNFNKFLIVPLDFQSISRIFG